MRRTTCRQINRERKTKKKRTKKKKKKNTDDIEGQELRILIFNH